MIRVVLTIVATVLLSAGAEAQDRAATLADIRQQLSVLSVEMQSLNRELSTTGSGMQAPAAASALERLDSMEAELRRMTALTEELAFRIEQVVRDGTNRVGDLEFRLTELEGGDLGQLGATPPLGGEVNMPNDPMPLPDLTAELAVGEQADFDAAVALMTEGTPADAHEALNRFIETYPRSPLAPEAHLFRGDALAGLGNLPDAGRAYLESFTQAEPVDPGLAAEALFKLGQTLAELGQTAEACVSLSQVSARFPGTTAAGAAETARASMTCS